MNQRKVGALFEYSNRYIHFLAFLKIGFKISYRTVQGIVRGLSDYIKIEEEMHFTQIRRRILKIKRPSVENLGCEEEVTSKNPPSELRFMVGDDAFELMEIRKNKSDKEFRKIVVEGVLK
jgi:hypothetical protein